MNEAMRKLAAELARMTSEEAAEWLMSRYPIDSSYGEAFILLAHRSWRREDQRRLARYYLQRMPFASSKPYEVFASFMSLRALIPILKEYLPESTEDMQLLQYHLTPILRQLVRSDDDAKLVEALFK